MEIDFHFVREMVARKQLIVKIISTTDQLADIFTKGLSTPRFLLLRDKLNLVDSEFRLRGSIKDKDTRVKEKVLGTESHGKL